MFENIFFIVMAILGLGVLIFLHELGHFIMARRAGMKVETFSIGFGKGIVSWYKNGVKWQVGYLPFGGFVKIAGMETSGDEDPWENKDGFFGKTPWVRIKVLAAGPLVNLLMGFLIFSFIWASGGREKPFSNFTHLIGNMDTASPLYEKGVRPGDEIVKYGGRDFYNFQDMLYASALNGKKTAIAGVEIDYYNNKQIPFVYDLPNYPDLSKPKGFTTIGIKAPAAYLIYRESNLMQAGTPLYGSGLLPDDRVIWADGELLFSQMQLNDLINSPIVLLTIERDQKILQVQAATFAMADLSFSRSEKAALSGLSGPQNQNFKMIPAAIDAAGRVARILPSTAPSLSRSPYAIPLQKNDRIIAVGGRPVATGAELFTALQQRPVQLIIERKSLANSSWKGADSRIMDLSVNALQELIAKIGLQESPVLQDNLCLLKTAEPKTLAEFPESIKTVFEQSFAAAEKEIAKIKDQDKRKWAQDDLQKTREKMYLGIPWGDLLVRYNPGPISLFGQAFSQIIHVLKGLLTGALNPKWISGPVAFVQVMKYGWMQGLNEALYWLGLISVNLGILNFLPIPALDGGHIVFALYEWIFKKRIRPKTMEKLILPFFILLLLLLAFTTFHDIFRLFS